MCNHPHGPRDTITKSLRGGETPSTTGHNHNVTQWWRDTKHDGTQSQRHSVVERHQTRRDTFTTSLSGGETPNTTGHNHNVTQWWRDTKH
ncbi:hypothetical protein LSAT2_008636, partial [Lamellibrachia satsuma]